MELFRISNGVHARDFSGTGAKLFGGRWNSIGTPLHYMAASRALAALEVLSNRNGMRNTKNLCLTVFEIETDLIKSINANDLPTDWKNYPGSSDLEKIGDDFANQNKHLLLKVPAVLVEDEFNFLMNVDHPLDNTIRIMEVKPFGFDQRLI